MVALGGFSGHPPNLNRVEQARDKKAVLKQMQAQALQSTDLSHEGTGSSATFASHRVIYRLSVIAVTNRPGSNSDSVTISVCQQGTG